jgi:hypothetical protein
LTVVASWMLASLILPLPPAGFLKIPSSLSIISPHVAFPPSLHQSA